MTDEFLPDGFVPDEKTMAEFLEKYENSSEEELIADLAISMLKNSPEVMKDLLTKVHVENGLPPATDEDIASLLENEDKFREFVKEVHVPEGGE